jgi:hypothetical protein
MRYPETYATIMFIGDIGQHQSGTNILVNDVTSCDGLIQRNFLLRLNQQSSLIKKSLNKGEEPCLTQSGQPVNDAPHRIYDPLFMASLLDTWIAAGHSQV